MPEPCILFAQTLEHQQLAEHVDEIQFDESVSITAFEIVSCRGASACSSVHLIGETWPASFALEVFARSRGEARFKTVCPAFTSLSPSPTSSSSSTFLETEVIVTDHVVLRGVYSALTLVVYGNPVRDLEFSSLVDDPLHFEAPAKNLSKLKLLQHVQAPELVNLVFKLVLRPEELSSAATSALITSAATEDRDHIISFLTQDVEPAESEEYSKKRALELLLTSVEAGLSLNHSDERFLGVLAAIKLLCLDTSSCFDFVVADGLQMLIRVLQTIPGAFTVAKTFALQALELCSRHSSACEAIIGVKPNAGYGTILTALLQAHRHGVSRLCFEVLQRFRVYELIVLFQAEVDFLVVEAELDDNSKERLIKAMKFLSLLINVLQPDQEANSSRVDLFMKAGFYSEDIFLVKLDPYLFTILKEKSFLSSIEALLSASILRNKLCNSSLLSKLLCTVQSFVVSLLTCEYGTLLLGEESKAAEALVKALCSLHSSEEESTLTLKQARILVKEEVFLCPREIERILQVHISVLNKFDNLLAASSEVDEVLFFLWDLVKLSRTHAVRHAIQTILRIDEVLSGILNILEQASQVTEEKLVVASHYAAEILYVHFTDPGLFSWVSWLPQASKLQRILLALNDAGDEEKDGVFSRLLLVLDSALVFRSKGAAELLRFSISRAGEDELKLGSALSDARVLQLTTCMQMLASISTPSVAAELIGEGAIGVLSSLLEYSATVLQGELEQKEINGAVKLIVPALVLLLKLSQRLRLEGLQIRNSKLLTALINLHRSMSGMLGACNMVFLHSWDEGGLEIFAALQLLASNLAYWLVFGWEPSLQARLFSSSSPNDPIETLSVLKLLGDLLPVERSPSHQKVHDISQELSAEIYLGGAQVNWHTQAPSKETLLEVLAPSISGLSDSILRLASTTCETLFNTLKSLVIRISCASATQAAIVLQPLLHFVEENLSAVEPSDEEILRVDFYLRFLAELSLHAASKAVILQLKSIKILSGALRTSLENQRLITVCPILKFYSRLCISESYLTFEDCCELASSLSYSSEVLPLDTSYESLAEAFESLSALRLGRAAFVSTGSRLEEGIDDNSKEQLLSRVMKRLCEALNAENARHSLLLKLAQSFTYGALTLAAAGKSYLGSAALKLLLGSEQVSTFINVIDRRIEETLWSQEDQSIAHQVKHALQVLLRLLQRPVQLQEVLSKVRAIESDQKSSVSESSTPFRNHPAGIHEQDLGARLEQCKGSFTWQCLSRLETPALKRKASGIRNLRKKLRMDSFSNSRKQVFTEDEVEENKNSLNMEEALDVFGMEDDCSPLRPLLKEDQAGRLGANSSAAPTSAKDFEEQLETTAASGAEIEAEQEQQRVEVLSTPAAWRTQELPTYNPVHQHLHLQQQQQNLQMGVHLQQPRFTRPQQSPVMMQQERYQAQSSIYQHHHHHHHHQELHLLPAPPPPQHEESLQQALASPEAIQDLLRDQARLTRLLEHHPRLLSLLQERFNF